ncbi:MAG: hypothetical protein EOP34_03215 [Rickettsiales bacterium]|nr:MAG: hypothetical protein EOP34_03215 [Rickettsiales bacterium]
MKQFINIISLILCSFLCSCGSYSDKFSCKYESGIPCKSMTQINSLIDQGSITEDIITNNVNTSNYKTSNKSKERISLRGTSKKDSKTHGQVTRIPERIARVWLNSFIDDKGDHISESYVHIVIEPGKWIEE